METETVTLKITERTYPLANPFTISSYSRTEITEIEARLDAPMPFEGPYVGERKMITATAACVPYARYGYTAETITSDIQRCFDRACFEASSRGGSLMPEDLLAAGERLEAGSASNIIDCLALDWQARCTNTPVWKSLNLPTPQPWVPIMATISLDTPDAMARSVLELHDYDVLKVKVGGSVFDDLARLSAIHNARPEAGLVVDTNEGWTEKHLQIIGPVLGDLGAIALEQPLPASDDGALIGLRLPVPVFADESVHTADNLAALTDRYQGVNVKLLKAGGLRPALNLIEAARGMGLQVMVGCMVSSSLAIAPAYLLAELADLVDLDGSVLLARDKMPSFTRVRNMLRSPPQTSALWGCV